MANSINPYSQAPEKSFWSKTVGSSDPLNLIYSPKFTISTDMRIGTAGSCFAQHIGRSLKKRKFNILDVEPARWSFPAELREKYSYGVYSARYGNIYSVRQLLQLVREVYCDYKPVNWIWMNPSTGRYYDAFRPSVEPGGFTSESEVLFHRLLHLEKVKNLFDNMELLIFTFGLTEAWEDLRTHTVFPTPPGVFAAEFDSNIYSFINFNYNQIYNDFLEVMDLLNQHSKVGDKKFLVTVSPVPLTATATGCHVLPATTYSKSVLRSVAGDLSNNFSFIDYFPSFEIVLNPWVSQNSFELNRRSVTPDTVERVMDVFMSAHSINLKDNISPDQIYSNVNIGEKMANQDDLICEEFLLDVFSNKESKS